MFLRKYQWWAVSSRIYNPDKTLQGKKKYYSCQPMLAKNQKLGAGGNMLCSALKTQNIISEAATFLLTGHIFFPDLGFC
jgi:hypothetical protein